MEGIEVLISMLCFRFRNGGMGLCVLNVDFARTRLSCNKVKGVWNGRNKMVCVQCEWDFG